jgi:hypothetical protein
MFEFLRVPGYEGYVAVFLGLTMFAMGYWKGKEVGFTVGATNMIEMLVSKRFLKIGKKYTDKDGNEITEFATYDD